MDAQSFNTFAAQRQGQMATERLKTLKTHQGVASADMDKQHLMKQSKDHQNSALPSIITQSASAVDAPMNKHGVKQSREQRLEESLRSIQQKLSSATKSLQTRTSGKRQLDTEIEQFERRNKLLSGIYHKQNYGTSSTE